MNINFSIVTIYPNDFYSVFAGLGVAGTDSSAPSADSNPASLFPVGPLAKRSAPRLGPGRHHGDEGRPGLDGGARLDMDDRHGSRGAGLQLVLHPLGIASGDTQGLTA